MPDYSTWLTKQQAAEAIGVSTKTVEKLTEEKQLQKAFYKRPETGVRIAVYHPEDVARLRKERNPEAEPFVLPAAEAEPKASEKALAIRQPAADQLFQALTAAFSGSQNSQKSWKLFLSIREAAKYSGLPQAMLRRMAQKEEIRAFKTALGWRISRKSLEEL